MDPYIIDWLNLAIRFAHVITGIAWIGASFYFVWLDNHLETPPTEKAEKGMCLLSSLAQLVITYCCVFMCGLIMLLIIYMCILYNIGNSTR